jgi:hypothetical protein
MLIRDPVSGGMARSSASGS